MKNVIMEYAGSAVAVLGTISFFLIIGTLLMGKDSMMASLITAVLGGL